MKDRIMMLAVAGGLVLAGFSMTAIGEAEPITTDETLDAVETTADEVVEAAEQAVETAEQALETIEDMDEELQAAGEVIQDAAEAVEAAEPEALPGGNEGSMQEAMAAWLLSSSPSEHHAKLDPFVGQWDVTVRFWMAPGLPPQVNQGTSEISWILDGRFLQENFQSVMQMGTEPTTFKGFGLTGYDNVKQQYVGIWADTMSTAVIPSTGQFDESTGGFVLTSEFDDPMTGLPTSMRMVLQSLGEDGALMQAFKPLGDQEFMCLEITYTRRP